MREEKYIGIDVYRATISGVVMDSRHANRGMRTGDQRATILEFIAGLRGTLSLTFEEGTSVAWSHDLSETPCQPAGGLPGSMSQEIHSYGRTSTHIHVRHIICSSSVVVVGRHLLQLGKVTRAPTPNAIYQVKSYNR